MVVEVLAEHSARLLRVKLGWGEGVGRWGSKQPYYVGGAEVLAETSTRLLQELATIMDELG